MQKDVVFHHFFLFFSFFRLFFPTKTETYQTDRGTASEKYFYKIKRSKKSFNHKKINNLNKLTKGWYKIYCTQSLTSEIWTGHIISVPAGSTYSLPIASKNTLGGIKVGDNLNIDENGILSANDISLSWNNIPDKPSLYTQEEINNKITLLENKDAEIDNKITLLENKDNEINTAINDLTTAAEKIANKETVINSATASDETYPSTRAVYDAVDNVM